MLRAQKRKQISCMLFFFHFFMMSAGHLFIPFFFLSGKAVTVLRATSISELKKKDEKLHIEGKTKERIE